MNVTMTACLTLNHLLSALSKMVSMIQTEDGLSEWDSNNNIVQQGEHMNKAQFIEKIATDAQMTKADTEKFLDSALDLIKKTVKKGDDVKLVGFGTFTKAKRKARTGRNPQTGKTIKIPAAWYPKFRPGAEFKDGVR